MTVSNSQYSNLFSNAELLASEIGPNMDDNLFANDSGSDIVNDDLSSDVDESFLTEQTPDDFQITDSDLLADDGHDCSLPSSRVRARSDFCAKETHIFEVKTNEDVKKYWCSQTDLVGLANIPVCNKWTGGVITTPATSIVFLQLCKLSKFIPV